MVDTSSPIIAAAAWRVKYRKTDGDGILVRPKVSIRDVGVHPKNRGGVFPNGMRCQSLCVDVVEAGFSKAEVSHQMVAVEEMPAVADLVRSRGDDYITGAAYNRRCSLKDELLASCFDEPYGFVRYLGLSHNHMMMILRAFLTKSKWCLPPNPAKDIVYLDDKGRLSLSAVAASPNGKELAELVEEGVPCEILSWKMDVEEPTAAAIISQALNKAHELALRTTELTAISLLNGEIIRQMGPDLSQRVAYKSVLEKLRLELDAAADDPDLPQLFDFLVMAGCGKNSYITDFLDFGAGYVNSTKRQLRFSAFAVPNQMPEQVPLTKIAIMKRAYRKKPSLGFCPNPEAFWSNCTLAMLEDLEALLRYFHGTCKAEMDKLSPQSRIKLQANIDVAAVEAFISAYHNNTKKKTPPAKIRAALLEATAKYFHEIGVTSNALVQPAVADMEWISFADYVGKEASEAPAELVPVQSKASVNVLTFDEQTGRQLIEQVQFESEEPPGPKKEKKPIFIHHPWREWNATSKELGAVEADRQAAVAVLQSIHEHYDVCAQPVNILAKDKTTYVVASADVGKEEIMLPPCVPKDRRVVLHSDHPHAVPLSVHVSRSDTYVANKASGVLRHSNFLVLPEYKAPRRKTTAVAESSGASAAVAESSIADWEWGNGAEETMHPFWAVRRLNQKQLDELIAEKNKNGVSCSLPKFNCKLQDNVHSSVNIATVKGKVVNCTRLVSVPYLTNTEDIAKGDELILEVFSKKKNNQQRRNKKRKVGGRFRKKRTRKGRR